jgi:lantibiotic modifying enzyme
MSASSDAFLAVAFKIGARLCRDAIWFEHRCNWMGASVWGVAPDVRRREYCACNADVFSGTAGIALFLANLFAVTNERMFGITAEGALRQALSVLDDIQLKHRRSYFFGLPGIAYVAFQLATLMDRPLFFPIAELLLDGADWEHSTDVTCNSLVDSADMIVSALSMLEGRVESAPSELTLETALRHGDRICNAETFVEGQAVRTTAALNVSWALLALAQHSEQKKYKRAASRWLITQPDPTVRSQFKELSGSKASPAETRDLRSSPMEVRRATLELALLQLCSIRIAGRGNLSPNPHQLKQYALAPIPVTSLTDISLATGTMGDIELLLRLGHELADSSYILAAERFGRAELARTNSNGVHWPWDALLDLEAPGLMLGSAGIGYALLRLYDSERIRPLPKPPLL